MASLQQHLDCLAEELQQRGSFHLWETGDANPPMRATILIQGKKACESPAIQFLLNAQDCPGPVNLKLEVPAPLPAFLALFKPHQIPDVLELCWGKETDIREVKSHLEAMKRKLKLRRLRSRKDAHAREPSAPERLIIEESENSLLINQNLSACNAGIFPMKGTAERYLAGTCQSNPALLLEMSVLLNKLPEIHNGSAFSAPDLLNVLQDFRNLWQTTKAEDASPK
jgi:hypothetical protein